MLWMGFTRPKAPVWGPFVSKLSAHEITLPLRTRVAARLITSGVMKLRVPISSSEPQRPQLRNFLQYSSSSAGVTAVFGPTVGMESSVLGVVPVSYPIGGSRRGRAPLPNAGMGNKKEATPPFAPKKSRDLPAPRA